MSETKTYPEINAMSLRECIQALAMGYRTRDNVKPEFLADLDSRLAAIEERKRRLEATAERGAR